MSNSEKQPYTLIPDLRSLVAEATPDSIISRTFYKDDLMRTILFRFDAGQELSEHTSAHTAVLHILSGDARVAIGEDTHELSEGAWLHMQPRLKHSVYAKTPVVMLLMMVDTP